MDCTTNFFIMGSVGQIQGQKNSASILIVNQILGKKNNVLTYSLTSKPNYELAFK